MTDSSNVAFSFIRITAPGKSVNTHGCHFSSSTNVNITDSTTGTGDDCISVGHGTSKILIARFNCALEIASGQLNNNTQFVLLWFISSCRWILLQCAVLVVSERGPMRKMWKEWLWKIAHLWNNKWRKNQNLPCFASYPSFFHFFQRSISPWCKKSHHHRSAL